MALQDDLKKAGLDPNRYTRTEERVALVLGTGEERLLPVGTKAQPGTPSGNRSGGRYEARTFRVFDEVAARNALKAYNTQTKQTTQTVNRLTSAAKNKTQTQKVEDFNNALISAESSGFRLNPNQRTLFNTYANLAKVGDPKNFNEAINNYSVEISQARATGIEKLTPAQKSRLERLARRVRDFDSPDLGVTAQGVIKNITMVGDAINQYAQQQDKVKRDKARLKNYSGKELETRRGMLAAEEDKLSRLGMTANQAIPRLVESFNRVGVSDVVGGLGGNQKLVGEIDAGLSELGADMVFKKSSLVGKLNSQVTDDQIRSDLAETRRKAADSVFQLGNATLVDLNSQLSRANTFLSGLVSNDPRREATQEAIAKLTKDIADVTADTNAAKAIVDSPSVGDDVVSNFREKILKLPEERALGAIREIDPDMMATAEGLASQFRSLSASPLGPTQDDRTEMMRGYIEDEALNQLRMGSALDESTRREVQQAARAAQTARGNIFGAAPAAEEIMQTGMMGEQRKAQRYGAAAAFLASGQTRGDQAARNTALRQSLDLTRLGAANEFISGGANPYNLANQRVANQNAQAINYLNAQTAAAKGFNNTANVVTPYQFINPNAGLEGARTSAMTYGNLLDFSSRNYSAYAGAQAQVAAANSVPNYISAFSSLVPSFSF